MHDEKPSLSVQVGAGGGSALVTAKIEGVAPFGEAVGYQAPDLWVSGFRWFWAISVCPAAAAGLVKFLEVCSTTGAAL